MPEYTPALYLSERGDRVRLTLGGLTTSEGATLQEAGNELVRRILVISMAERAGEIAWTPALRPAPGVIEFLGRIGHVAAAGGDIRALIFGPAADRAE